YIIAGRSQTPEKICERLDDTWDWVSPRPERQSDAATGAPLDVESAHAEIEVPHMHKAHKKRRALGLRALSLGAPKKGSRRTNAQRDYEAKARRGLHEYDDLKTNSENHNEKANMPLFPSPEPEVSYSNDLDFFKDFENEFPAIVYNDALMSKSDFSIEPSLCPQHIDKFNLKDETSLFECDEKEQNVLYFNDLFSFNVIYLDDLKSDTKNDNDKIDIEQPSRDMSVIPLPNCKLFSRGISILLAVGTPSTGSGKLYCQWELSSSSGNALCILFPTYYFLVKELEDPYLISLFVLTLGFTRVGELNAIMYVYSIVMDVYIWFVSFAGLRHFVKTTSPIL
nr:hypothetical protein [Tanacetum cinerariifolium]